MRIVVTGSTGFIGRHLLPYLGRDHEIIALTTKTPAGFPIDRLAHLSFVQADLLRAGAAEDLFKRFPADLLIHLAWHLPPSAFWSSPWNMDWLATSLLLVRAFERHGGHRLVMVGSGAEYDWSAPMPLREESSPLQPRSLYGVCKNSLRQAMEAFSASVGLSFLWCRLFWPYGPGEASEKFLSALIGSLARKESAICRGSNLKRDYIHVDDVGRALALAAVSTLSGTLNIGSGKGASLGLMAQTAAEAMGRSEFLILNEAEITDECPELVAASVQRLRGELGFTPSHCLWKDIAAMARAALNAEDSR